MARASKAKPLGANLGATIKARPLGATIPRTGPGSRTGERARSGPNIPESEREAKVITARLAPDVRAALEELQERWGLSRSATLARLILEAK